MLVLGISGAFGHDTAACLIQDGVVVAMAEEERFLRKKHAPGAVPVHAALYCLAEAGVSYGDLDWVAASWDPGLQSPVSGLGAYLEAFLDDPAWRRYSRPAVAAVDHHLAHAASAFYGSGFSDAAILIVDGNGEDAATSIGYGRGREIRVDQRIGIEHSLGHFYKSATVHLGFGQDDEGKMMGLASYGRPVLDLDLVDLHTDGYALKLPFAAPSETAAFFPALYRAWQRWLVSRFGPPRLPTYRYDPATGNCVWELEITDESKAIAASVQQALTNAILHLADLAVRRYGTRRLVIAGGVGLNCTANGVLLNSGVVDELFLLPAATDPGAALGAAYLVASQAGMPLPFVTPFLGPGFKQEVTADRLKQLGIAFSAPHDVAEYAAELLERGAILGWFSGRMEVGPRALGNRSWLALPASLSARDRVNRMKGREMWRPLSPSFLQDEIPGLVLGNPPSPFMLTAVSATEAAQKAIPAVVHVDGTMRPQVVSQDQEPYVRLLQAVKRRTGVPAVLNTSFNLVGEPIVCTPADALRTFFLSELDALVLEGLIVHKPDYRSERFN